MDSCCCTKPLSVAEGGCRKGERDPSADCEELRKDTTVAERGGPVELELGVAALDGGLEEKCCMRELWDASMREGGKKSGRALAASEERSGHQVRGERKASWVNTKSNVHVPPPDTH